MRENTKAIEVSTADFCSRSASVPGYIKDRILYVKRSRARNKAEEITDPLLATRKKIIKAKLARI